MVELGFSGRYSAWFWDVAVYQNDIDDLITYVSDPVTWNGTMENVESARIRVLNCHPAMKPTTGISALR